MARVAAVAAITAITAITAVAVPQPASSSNGSPTSVTLQRRATEQPSDAGRRRDACGKVTLKRSGEPWRCSFVDNFRSKRLNRDKWLVVATKWSGFSMGSSCLFGKNVKVRKGALRLVGRDEGKTFLCRAPSRTFNTRYSGGHITTYQHFSQTYGRFAARVRFPKSPKGVRGAFWMYPEELTYGRWPHSGEFDVAEWWSNKPHTVMPSLHYTGRNRLKDSGRKCKVRNAAKYHVYQVDWSSKRMVFTIDGKRCFRRSWSPSFPLHSPQPFDHSFVMLLTMGVDRVGGHNGPTSQTRLPATMTVDYVKAWK